MYLHFQIPLFTLSCLKDFHIKLTIIQHGITLLWHYLNGEYYSLVQCEAPADTTECCGVFGSPFRDLNCQTLGHQAATQYFNTKLFGTWFQGLNLHTLQATGFILF